MILTIDSSDAIVNCPMVETLEISQKFLRDTEKKTIIIDDEILVDDLLSQLEKYLPEYRQFKIVSKKETRLIPSAETSPWTPYDFRPTCSPDSSGYPWWGVIPPTQHVKVEHNAPPVSNSGTDRFQVQDGDYRE